MPEALLTVLKLCCLALLYLFFLRVLRAVWAELRPPRELAAASPGPAAAAAGTASSGRGRGRGRARPSGRGRGPATHLVVLEPPERRGQAYALDGDELTVGRAAGCSVALGDGYASSLHARVFRRDGALYLEDLGSTNGTWLNERRLTGPSPVQRGDRVKIGGTLLEVAG